MRVLIMEKIVIKDFDIKINKERVLSSLGCKKGDSVYNTVSGYFDDMENELYSLLSVRALAAFDENRVYCLITASDAISAYSKELFDRGEGMRGLLCDAMADDYLFEADKALARSIKEKCALLCVGVKRRLDAPKDFPLTEQKLILEKTGAENVSLTDAFMLSPVKTFAYILELTSDNNVFNAQHDCSKCDNLGCVMRDNTEDRFEAVSEYAYIPKLKSGDSAVCIDIGTTTIVFELITENGTVKIYKTVNPQRRFGADVLSRIDAANRGRESELSAAVKYVLLKGYKYVTENFGDVKKVIIAGNTAMIHLLMEYPCDTLGAYPFTSNHLDTIRTTFDSVTGSDTAKTETIILGGISPFVGADIVSGLYMCGFDRSDGINAFIDLGTNGEMAVGNSKKILVSSAAAGPAFEGGRISCGTGSVDGAVCGVNLKNGEIKTIGNKAPAGICGTGIIELVSELLDNNIIDKTGLLKSEYFDNGFPLTDNIIFTQNDIRQVQMAKSAVRAGLETLIKAYGTSVNEINTVYLAGGFGHGLSPQKACNIGILPKAFQGKTVSLGNSSLGGLVKYCCKSDGHKRIENIKSISREISLGTSSYFKRLYIEYMNF